MAVVGYLNVDFLVHDSTADAIKVLDIDSTVSITGAVASVSGTATSQGVDVDPSNSGYRNAAGESVSLATVSALACKGDAALTVTAGGVVLQSAAGQAAVTALSDYSGNITVQGSGSFQLMLVGEE